MRGTIETSLPMSSPTHDPDAALGLFNGNLTEDTLRAHLQTLRGDPHWRVFVLEGPKVRDVELIYRPTNAWYVLRLTKVRRLRGSVWRRAW